MKVYTPEEAARVAHRHPDTVREALRSGELVGKQRKVRGPWSISESALEKWVFG